MKLFISFLVILLSACSSSNRYENYYSNYGNNLDVMNNKESKFTPKLIDTFDINGKVSQYEKQGYVVLGGTTFVGEWEARSKSIDFARSIGATVIITQSNLTGSMAKKYNISVPASNTSLHLGSIATYTGNAAIQERQQFSRSYSLGQYKQEAVFLARKGAK